MCLQRRQDAQGKARLAHAPGTGKREKPDIGLSEQVADGRQLALAPDKRRQQDRQLLGGALRGGRGEGSERRGPAQIEWGKLLIACFRPVCVRDWDGGLLSSIREPR